MADHPSAQIRRCLECGGEGKVMLMGPADNMDIDIETCEHCDGTGRCADLECDECDDG